VNELEMNFYNGRWYEGAIEMFNRKAELSENGLSVQEKELLGRSFYQIDELQKCENVFAEIIAAEPENITGYIFMARTYAKLEEETGNTGIAEPKFMDVINKFENQSNFKNEISEAYIYMISLYTQKRSYSTMRTWAAKLKELDPQNKNWVLRALNAEALSWYYQAAASDNKDENAFVNARAAYQEIYNMDPSPATRQTIEDLTKQINYIRNLR
jgi:tetratricopeptide (TPR) repeat protein